MSVKTVVCVICKEQVTKRQSLAYGGGRACRHHPEVEKMVKDAAEDKLWARAEENLKVISLAACIRSMHTVRGYPVEMAYMRIRKEMGVKMADKVKTAVEEQGGPKMSQQEIEQSIATWAHLVMSVNRNEKAESSTSP